MILVFIDTAEGQIKKSAYEVITYGVQIAQQLGTTAEGIVLGKVEADLTSLGNYGLSKVHYSSNNVFETFDSRVFAKAVADAAQQANANIIIFHQNQNGKAIAPRVAAKLKAAFVAGATDLPDTSTDFVVKKSVFSGKAFAYVQMLSPIKVITLNPNSFHVAATQQQGAEIINFEPQVAAASLKVVSINKVSGEVPLTEAEIVVSGGRGLKGPENWHIIEDLAHVLHAATACSRPVADAHWRPHHEHVGQTGIQIAPNLYIAIGISGAIQHLAGVNRSKYIVVINKDPEAPFFKAADYGIVGDAFEVVPKLTEEIKKLKQ